MTKIFLYILLPIVLTSFLPSCAKEESRDSKVPDARVEIDIQTQLENDFDNPYYSKKYYSDLGKNIYAGYVGVIAISNSDASWIYAYDLCCPYEAPQKNELAMSGTLKVKCPKCKSEYNISDGTGRVESGPATEKLKRYTVLKSGLFYRIRN